MFPPGKQCAIEKNLLFPSNLQVAHMCSMTAPHTLNLFVWVAMETQLSTVVSSYLILLSGTNSLLQLLQATKICDICSVLAVQSCIFGSSL